MAGSTSTVVLAKTADRKEGIKASLKVLGINPAKGKHVLIKPNFNTVYPAPGSTHNDTLVGLIEKLWSMGAKSISVGERSPPLTRQVMEEKGILPILEKLNVRVIDFDDLKDRDWVECTPRGQSLEEWISYRPSDSGG